MKRTEIKRPWFANMWFSTHLSCKSQTAAITFNSRWSTIILTILFLIQAGQVKAETRVWGGTTGTGLDWTLASNWSGGIAPAAGDDIVFDTPGTITFSVLPSSVSYKSITILQGTVTIASESVTTFAVGGNEGTDFSVSSGASFILGTDADIDLCSGSVAEINGSLIIENPQMFNAGDDQVSVSVGGVITNNGIYNLGNSDALTTVTGSFINSGIINSQAVTQLVFAPGSVYNHARDGGAIPLATWDAASLCLVSGNINTHLTIPAATQPFGNFTWNCPGQLVYQDLEGELTAVNGNLVVKSTGSANVQFGRYVNSTLTVNGNFTQTGGTVCVGPKDDVNEGALIINGDFSLSGTGVFYVCTSNGKGTLDVFGDMTILARFNFTFIENPAIAIVNAHGNVVINGGIFNMSQTSSTGILNVSGNFTHTYGLLTETDTGGGNIIFNGTGMQLYTSGGTIADADSIDFTVSSGSYLQMAASNTRIGGRGVFRVSEGATLGVTSPDGITADKTVITGNICTTGGRVFNPLANYIYNGTTVQSTGTGLAGAATLTVNNASGVSLCQPVIITNMVVGDKVPNSIIKDNGFQILSMSGTLDLVSGTFSLGSSTAATTIPEFTALNYGEGTTIEYTSSFEEIIPAGSYPNLVLTNSKKQIEAGSSVTVNGNLVTNDNLEIQSTLGSGGSLIVKGTSAGTVTYKRQLRTEANGGDFHIISSPVSGNTEVNTGKITGLKAWNEATGAWVDAFITSMNSGAGYIIDQTSASDGLIKFTGAMVTSDVIVEASSPYADVVDPAVTNYNNRIFATGRNNTTNYGGGGWTALGNPYTSAISALSMLSTNNSNIDPSFQAIYLYDGTNGTSGTCRIICNQTGWEEGFTPATLQTGQGFMMRAMNDNSVFTFTPALQLHDNNVSLLKEEPVTSTWPGLRLKVAGASAESSTLILFNIEMTAGLDPGYDIGYMPYSQPVEIYTTLVNDNGVNFTRQALPTLNYDQNIVSVGVKSASGGEVTFSADIVPVDGYKFYLEDRTAGIFTDLTTGNYTVTLPANTTGTGRFFLYTSSGDPSSTEPSVPDLDDIRIWSDDSRILIKGSFESRAKCSVYDLSGRKIAETTLDSSDINVISINNKSKGIYIVVVTDGKNSYSKKIIL